MKIRKYTPEVILKEIAKLEVQEFLGICKILGVELMNGETPKGFTTLWEEICDKVATINRTKRKNLIRLLRAANEGR